MFTAESTDPNNPDVKAQALKKHIASLIEAHDEISQKLAVLIVMASKNGWTNEYITRRTVMIDELVETNWQLVYALMRDHNTDAINIDWKKIRAQYTPVKELPF